MRTDPKHVDSISAFNVRRKQDRPAPGTFLDRRCDAAGSVPQDLAARFVRYALPRAVTLYVPDEAANSPHRVITGQALGEMHMRGALHHYRVAGDDGFLYLAPPSWIAPKVQASPVAFDFRLLERVAIASMGFDPWRSTTYTYPPPGATGPEHQV